MGHDSAIIELRVSLIVNLSILVVKDYSFITLLDIVFAAVVWGSLHKWELIAAIVVC